MPHQEYNRRQFLQAAAAGVVAPAIVAAVPAATAKPDLLWSGTWHWDQAADGRQRLLAKLTPTQAAIATALDRRLCFCGGMGSGKTVTGVARILLKAQPRQTYLVYARGDEAVQRVAATFRQWAVEFGLLNYWTEWRAARLVHNGAVDEAGNRWATVDFTSPRNNHQANAILGVAKHHHGIVDKVSHLPSADGVWLDDADGMDDEIMFTAVGVCRPSGWILATGTNPSAPIFKLVGVLPQARMILAGAGELI